MDLKIVKIGQEKRSIKKMLRSLFHLMILFPFVVYYLIKEFLKGNFE